MKFLLVPLFLVFSASLWANDRPKCKGSKCSTGRDGCRPESSKDKKCEKMCAIEGCPTYTFLIVFPDKNPASGGPKIPVKPVNFSLRGKK